MKDIKRKLAQNVVFIRIIESLKNKELSISELQRELNMKRATLIYYLNNLKARGLIVSERMEKEKGRPTKLKFNSAVWKKEGEELKKRMMEEEEEIYNKIAGLPETQTILQVIDKNPNIDLTMLLSHSDIKDIVRKFDLVNWLHRMKYIKESFSITKEGKDFIKSHHKLINPQNKPTD